MDKNDADRLIRAVCVLADKAEAKLDSIHGALGFCALLLLVLTIFSCPMWGR